MAETTPTPAPPKPTDWSKLSWLATPASILLAGVLIAIGPHYLPSVDPAPLPLPPAPVVIEQIKVEPTDAIATKDGIRLNAESTRLVCDMVNNGNGRFVLRHQPVGQPELNWTITVSGGIVPPEPKPDPKPDPKPPGPDPTPDPPPIPVTGFRVLMVYENNPTDPAATLTKEQRGALSSQAVRSYLDSKCAKGKDGKTPEWRAWDQHVDVTNETDIWKDAMKLPRNVLPWIVISDGKAGHNGPLPANEAELLALLKKHGG